MGDLEREWCRPGCCQLLCHPETVEVARCESSACVGRYLGTGDCAHCPARVARVLFILCLLYLRARLALFFHIRLSVLRGTQPHVALSVQFTYFNFNYAISV